MPFGWVAGATVVGGLIGADASRKATNTQADIARESMTQQDKSLQAQIDQANKLLDFNEKVYDEGKDRQAGLDSLNERVINQNMDLAAKAGQRSDDTYDFYKTVGRPVVQQSITDAQNFDSQGNIDAARGRASADVQQGFDDARGQSQRALTRMGVNPSSGRFMALQQRLQADQALGQASAMTNAEQGVRDQAIGLRQQASNLAQGFPAQSLGQATAAGNLGTTASGVAGAGAAAAQANSALALNGMATGASIYGSAAGGYGNMYGTAMNGANNAAATGAYNMQGWGQLGGNMLGKMNLGMGGGGAAEFNSAMSDDPMAFEDLMGAPMANGGKVRGPGTGTSDSVPAVNTNNGQPIRLSNGEYVLSADTVRAVGTKFLDNLQAKHHTPVRTGNLRGKA